MGVLLLFFLPSDSMAKLGLAGGITTQVLAASAAVYTLYLLSALYHEFKRSLVRSDSPLGGIKMPGRSVLLSSHNSAPSAGLPGSYPTAMQRTAIMMKRQQRS